MKKGRKTVALLLAATVLGIQIYEPVYAEELNAGQESMTLETDQETDQETNGPGMNADEYEYTDSMPGDANESDHPGETVLETENEDISENHDSEEHMEEDSEEAIAEEGILEMPDISEKEEKDDIDIREEEARNAWEAQMRSQSFLDHGPDDLDAGNDISVASDGMDGLSLQSATSENINNILVLVRFHGQDEYMNAEKSIRLNQTYNTMEGSMQEYISEMSYGELNVSTQFFPQSSSATYYSIEVDQPIEYYLAATAENTEGYFTFSERMEREKALWQGFYGCCENDLYYR